MKLNWYKGIVFLFVTTIFSVSCGDADLFDTDKWSNKISGWEPDITLKVAHGKFTLWDLINQGNDSVIIKENNNLMIRYTKEKVYSMPVEKIFKMPAEGQKFMVEIPDLGLPDGTHVGALTEELHREFSLEAEMPDIPEGCVLSSLILSGKLYCIFPEDFSQYFATITFDNMTDANGQPVSMNKELEATYCYRSLDPMEIHLAQNNKLNFTFDIRIPEGVELPSSTLGALTFQLQDMKFIEAAGNITTDQVTVDPGDFNMDVDFLDEIEGDFTFTNPELNLVIHNKGIGVPVSLNMVFENKGMLLELDEDETLIFEGNPSNQGYVAEKHGLNKDNSNIVPFLSMPPTGNINYSGVIDVNPGHKNDTKVYGDGNLWVDAEISIPFALSADNLIYKDTLTDIDIDQKYADKIEYGYIVISATNDLPLNLRIPKLILLDEFGYVLEGLAAEKDNDVIKASENSNPVSSSLRFKLSHEQAVKLGRTKDILLEAVASTTNNNGVVIEADATIAFDLQISAKASIKDLDDF